MGNPAYRLVPQLIFSYTFKRKYAKAQEMRELVLQLTRIERGTRGQKRFIFNFVGQVVHSLFGILDSESEAFYSQKIAKLGKERLNWLKLIREQVIVVRSELKSVSQTLHDVSANELTLTRQLREILKCINVRNKKI
jgi:hypothetical protein